MASMCPPYVLIPTLIVLFYMRYKNGSICLAPAGLSAWLSRIDPPYNDDWGPHHASYSAPTILDSTSGCCQLNLQRVVTLYEPLRYVTHHDCSVMNLKISSTTPNVVDTTTTMYMVEEKLESISGEFLYSYLEGLNAFMEDLTEVVGDVSRFTANALEQMPLEGVI